ncbi:RES family NAD+ phosphorylase [Conexibacter sp. SYSU D00693]|uniref:RES family NAD+ phosphorylase n=1 Tax=Conexibacter sp. SYSU D00693 TaxID=2812560 RepID=UPI00196B1E78|nr:RES family NAD+ phosphorylase [Conexibacter sp. SYSU D00693]
MAPWTAPPERAAGVWQAFRHAAREVQPLWYGGGAVSLRQESGRWHREGEGVAQYLSLSANGAWAERCRYAAIHDDARRLEERRGLWELQVQEHDVADLSTFDAYVACGLDPAIAVGPHAACQALADALRAEGFRGVLSPAAAFDQPGAVNLTLFGERVEVREHGAMPPPQANRRPDVFVPAVLVADAGSPTRYAMEHTCHPGTRHATFAAWRASR